MRAMQLFTPLVLSIALFGCSKTEQPTQQTQSSAPAPTAPASNTATATNNTATADVSAMTPEQHITAREDIMGSWGKASKAIRGMVENPASFNADELKTLAQQYSQDPWVHFPETAKGDSKPEIWSDNAKFQQEIDKFKKAVSDFQAVTATATSIDNVKEQFGQVGASCKSCHESFKKD